MASQSDPAGEPSPAHPLWGQILRIPRGRRIALAIAVIAAVAVASWAALGGLSSLLTRESPAAGKAAALELTAVPDLTGKTLVAAKEVLRGLDLDWSTSAYPSDQPPGTVLHQTPQAGTEVQPGSSVSLIVAEPYPKLPDVVGKKLKFARGLLAELDVRLKVVREASSRPSGVVISQDPPAGTRVRPRRLVTIVVAKPLPPRQPAPEPQPAPQPAPQPSPTSIFEPEEPPWEP